MMDKNTKFLTTSAILAALSVVFLYLGSVMPTGRAGFAGAAGVFTLASVIETGRKGGVSVYAVSALLALILVPDKTAAVLYTAFLGYYPIVKSIAESRRNRVLEWIVKLACLNAALILLMLVLKDGFSAAIGIRKGNAAVIAVVNAAFVLYDIGLSGIAAFYVTRISRKRK